jgi:hypothetical protein
VTVVSICSSTAHVFRLLTVQWYTMIATGIRIAQTLNLDHFGSDSYPASTTAPPASGKQVVHREICKRIWWGLAIQGEYLARTLALVLIEDRVLHIHYNGTSAIAIDSFDTAVPLHAYEDALDDPSTLQALSIEVPTNDSHTSQLLRGKYSRS